MTLSANNGGTLTGQAEGNAVGSRAGLTAWERSIVVGLLLGDGHLERSRRGLARLHVRQHPTRREYVDWLYQQLQRFVRTPPRIVMSRDRRTGVATPRYGFKTLAYPIFGEWHRRFYRDGPKRIPEEIGEWLDAVSLAVWFADDGSFKTDSRGLLLNTNAFALVDQQRLQGALWQRFALKTSLHKLRQWQRIYIPARCVCDSNHRSSQTPASRCESYLPSSDARHAPSLSRWPRTSQIPVAWTIATETVGRTVQPALPGLRDFGRPAPRSDRASFPDDSS